jgi:tRNA threonylcarbamoyl adenosine modification protein YjeE
MFHHTVIDLDALAQFAAHFLQVNPTGVFGLQGDLGVGKTAFVRSVVETLWASYGHKAPRVISPSYVLHQQYRLSDFVRVDHFDLYRLDTLTEEGLVEMGFMEALESAKTGSLLFVEWPERLPALYSPERFLYFNFLEQGREIFWT